MKIEKTFYTLSESRFKHICKYFSTRFPNGYEDQDFDTFFYCYIDSDIKNKIISELKFSVNVDIDQNE